MHQNGAVKQRSRCLDVGAGGPIEIVCDPFAAFRENFLGLGAIA
jgi:hypothetical protein